MKNKFALSFLAAALVVITGHINIAEAKVGSTAEATDTDQVTIEKRVREYFSDIPDMIEIARCESKFRQYTDSGNILRSNGMIGVFQFYEAIHSKAAKDLGFDLETIDGNIGYAKHIYDSEGTTPWNGSSHCWKTSSTPNTVVTSLTSTKNKAELQEQIDTLLKLISVLQQLLALQSAQHLS